MIRAGFGFFYDRIPLTVTLNNLRYNGINQQSYLILNPAFFPTVPPAAALEANRQPQQLRPAYSGMQAPRLYQGSVGVERQLNQASRVTLTWIHSRGVHLLNLRNTNAPIQGSYPAGDRSIRLLTESAGTSRLNQLVAGANINYRKLYLFGSYTLSYGMADNEGLPADPYNLRAEWGPSSYGDLRHRAAGGVTVPLPCEVQRQCVPAGEQRTALQHHHRTGSQQHGLSRRAPRAGSPRSAVRLSVAESEIRNRIWLLQSESRPGRTCNRPEFRARSIGGESRSSRVAHLDVRPGRQRRSAGRRRTRGAASGMSGRSGRKYSVVLSASTLNALNHPNFATPNGDLSSPYFGQYRSLGGLAVMSHGGAPSTYNRKIDLQLRFTF